MIIEIYQILLVAAIVATAFVILAGSKGGVGDVMIGSRTGIVISAAVVILWGLVAVNSFEVTVHSGGTSFTQSYEEVAWIAVGGGAVALYSLLQATIAEIQDTGGL